MKKTLLLILALFAILTTSFSQTKITDENAVSKILVDNDRLIIVEFYTDNCGDYCERMKPIMIELAQKYKGSVDYYRIDHEDNFVGDELGVEAVPAYCFFKNKKLLEVIVGAKDKETMEIAIALLLNYELLAESSDNNEEENEEEYNVWTLHGEPGELKKDNYQHIWDDSKKLYSLAWHVSDEHSEHYDFIRAIDIIKRSIELDANYPNLNTHAVLLYKTKNYTEAIKKAVEAIEVAKATDHNYYSTLNLIEKIINDMK